MSNFLEHEDDAKKAVVFGDHTDLWRPIEKEVMDWTHANWHQWKIEKPEWFTERFIASVPDKFIPNEVLVDLNKAAGGSKRRSTSASESVTSTSAIREK